jgi:hypothetical protein
VVTVRWRIEVAHENGPYTLSSEHHRAWDAFRAWEDLDAYLTHGQRKRLLHGRVINRVRLFRRPAPAPTPPVAQEALWTA